MYLQPVTELRRTQINVVKSKGTLKVPSAAAIRQLTTDHSLGLGCDFTEGGVDFTEGGVDFTEENPEKNPRSTGDSTHISSEFFENEHEAIPRLSPIQL